MSPEAAWTAYWQGAGRAGCLPGAPQAVVKMLEDSWRSFASGLPPRARLLDLATGAGAVPMVLRSDRPDLQVTGVDSAEVRGEGLIGGVDCAALPFADGSFEAVTSQFGVEYCGTVTLAEAARVLAPGGQLRFVVHDHDGLPIRHNRARHAALRDLIDAGLFQLGRRMAAGLGEDPAVARDILATRSRHRDQGISDELPMAIGQALQSLDATTAIDQLDARASAEVARLGLMLDAALDHAGASRMIDRLRDGGVEAELDALQVDGRPLAWMIKGCRPLI